MKMSRFTTQLVVALSLCLLLLGFSYSAEASARQITGAAAAARLTPNTDQQCNFGNCGNNDDCRAVCQPLGYLGGYCKMMASSSNGGEKIDVNRYHVAYPRCCCVMDL
ncbi:hypothetical protein MKW98_020975 [Papaver atlanticum]|uniref:Uncharacterized protein n=1 Tax=Papaver atlanticum TaxID=357466 RepID=A0AAD4SL37_9MAGN|nr:hypothetical protein MKW98_020975 [Papaver atlanticum]